MQAADPSPLEELGRWPGAFSMVMATGILSVAADDLAVTGLSDALLGVAVAAELALLRWHGPALARGLRTGVVPGGAFGSLTFVAGTAVLGSRLAGPASLRYVAGLAAWLAAFVAWLGLTRAPAKLLAAPRRRISAKDVSGEWCLAAVAPFSLAVLAAELAGLRGSGPLLLTAVALWFVGALAYALASSALAARLVRRRLALVELTPDWWITMGGLAIATLATDSIARAVPAAGLLDRSLGEIHVVADATWWGATALIVPLATAFGLRLARARRARQPARVWAAIFPLGMYAVASHRLGVDHGAAAQEALGEVFFWGALVSWLAAAVAVVRSGRVGTPTRPGPREPAATRRPPHPGAP